MRIEGTVITGAGPIKTKEDVLVVSRSKADGMSVGSMTVDSRAGNPGTTFYMDPQGRFGLNSKGMPNGGFSYYKQALPEMVDIAHDHGKILIANIAGFNSFEFGYLARMAVEAKVDGVELNLGCPNIWGPDGQKEIISHDSEAVARVLEVVEQSIGREHFVIVKLSPLILQSLYATVPPVLAASRLVNAVASCNTLPNAYATANGAPAISFGQGLAGMSGPVLKLIAVSQTRQLRPLLPGRIQLIGVGGITQKSDIDEYRDAGAVATQVVTAYINEGPAVFDRLAK